LARAKRTDRTDARRRYRASQAAVAADPEAAALPADAKATAAKGSAPKGSPGAAPQQRPSITTAFKSAYRPAHVMDDLRAFPLVVRNLGLLAALVIAVASSALFVASTASLAGSLDFSLSNPLGDQQIGTLGNISYLALSLFVAPAPAAGAFIVGFTASRASWLGGLLYGLVAALCYSLVLLSPSGPLLTGGDPVEPYISNAWALSPVATLLLASAAAWYKRFLNLANPNRAARNAAKAQQGRGNVKPNSRATPGR
jgi:hypothetical protein